MKNVALKGIKPPGAAIPSGWRHPQACFSANAESNVPPGIALPTTPRRLHPAFLAPTLRATGNLPDPAAVRVDGFQVC